MDLFKAFRNVIILLVLVDVVNGDEVFPCIGNQYGIKSKSGNITCKFCDLRAKCPRGQGVSFYIKCRSLIPAGTHSHCEDCKFRETYSSTFDSRPCQKCPQCHENEATTGWCNQYSNTVTCTGKCKQGFYTLSGQVKDCQPCSTCQFPKQVKLPKCKEDDMPSSKQCEKMIEIVTKQPSLISPTSQEINHSQRYVAIETASSGSLCGTLCIGGWVVAGTMIIGLIWIIYSKCFNGESGQPTTVWCNCHDLTQPASETNDESIEETVMEDKATNTEEISNTELNNTESNTEESNQNLINTEEIVATCPNDDEKPKVRRRSSSGSSSGPSSSRNRKNSRSHNIIIEDDESDDEDLNSGNDNKNRRKSTAGKACEKVKFTRQLSDSTGASNKDSQRKWSKKRDSTYANFDVSKTFIGRPVEQNFYNKY